jgi:hypothetical protein
MLAPLVPTYPHSLGFILLTLSQPHAVAATVLVDELDAPFFSLQFRHLQGHFHEMQGSPSGCWVKVFVLQGVNHPPLLERAGRKTRICSEDIKRSRGNLRSFPFLRRPFSGGQNPRRSPWRRAGFVAY